MAKQHFYSCVPAKMSLFNRMDGYDTFAHSDGIDGEQMAELAVVYDNKPTKADTDLMREGKLPPVYCQFINDRGTLIQSCISFIKSDYTGERSSYMVHSLLLDDEEKSAHLHTLDAACLNKDVFKHNLADFDITSANSSPDTKYPEIAVPVKNAVSTESIAEKYDTGMLKRLIYTMVGVSCGKIKSLYLSLPSFIDSFSEDCLEFINAMFGIFPYHMREALSFVTYIGDITKFNSFKIKCISENAPAIPSSKGISIRMGIKDFSGVTDENVASHADIVDFFYGLLTDNAMRKDFIEYFDYAVKAIPELNKPSFKNLSDMIFVFKYLSGYFDEMSVLPNDDKVYEFITVYDKNREALKQEYKDKAVEFLHRYPQSHTAIPKNVFAKISNIYLLESESFKKTVMSVAIELIHTDLMREKLFLFIKANYENESPETKEQIMQSVCRVYYGGFLQESIFEFLSEHFENEPQNVRDIILEKLLLTIRTPKVQQQVLQFADKFYGTFSPDEKKKVFDTFFEMLPLADNLSRGLSNIVDSHIEDSQKDKVKEFVLKCLDEDEHSKKPKLCAVLSTKCGFIESVIAKKVFETENNEMNVDAFLSGIGKKPMKEKISTVTEVWTCVPNLSKEYADKLYSAVLQTFSNDTAYTVFDLVDAIDEIDKMSNDIPQSSEFAKALKENVLYPAISACVPKLFDVKRYPDGIERISELAVKRSYISECEGFASIKAYLNTVEAFKTGKPEQSVMYAEKIVGKPARQGAAVLFKNTVSDFDKGEDNVLFSQLILSYLKSDELDFSESAVSLKDFIMNNSGDGNTSESIDLLNERTEEKVLESVLNAGAKVYETDISEELKALLISANSPIFRYVSSYISRNEKKGKKTVLAFAEKLSAKPEYTAALNDCVSKKQSSVSFLKKLFKK